MPKKLNIGNALLAEFVTKGNRNKHVLVNVYSGDIIVREFPADLGFGLYIELLQANPEDVPSEFTMEMTFAGETIVKADGRPADGAEIKSNVTFTVSLLQFVANGPGQLEISISAKGFKKAMAISKRIYQDVFA